MNICFIPPIISGTVSGGINTQINKTAEALISKGHKITYFNSWEKYNWQQFDMVHIFRADAANLALGQWLNENNIPFVISPIFFSSHKHSRVKNAIKFTELNQKILSGITSDLLIKKELCNLSSFVLPNTYEEQDLIAKSMNISINKMHVIHNGIDTSFSTSTPDLFYKKFGIKDFVLSTGHFGFKRKNLERLIKAVKDIDCKLVLIGSLFSDSYSNNCKKLIKSSSNIILIDTLKHDDPLLASAYSAAKVFALPSLYETPGLSALEAAICKCNIVITPFGGTKEYFEDWAQYPNPLSITSIKNAILDSLQKDYNSDLQDKILNKYNWNTIANNTLDIYKKIISQIQQ